MRRPRPDRATRGYPGEKRYQRRQVGQVAQKGNRRPVKGSKTAQFLEFLKRSGGAILKRTHKNPGCQAHSVRGFLSGALGKKMGLTVTSTEADDEERRYSAKRETQPFGSQWPLAFRLSGFSLSVPRARALVLAPSLPTNLFTACLFNALAEVVAAR